MRILSLVLILANALYFVWAQMIDVRPTDLERDVPPVATPPPRIVLAREKEKAPPEPAQDETDQEQLQDVQPPSVEPLARSAPDAGGAGRLDSLSCSSIGPFPDLSQASQAQAALKQDSAQCWRLARKARMTEAQANQNLATGYLIGGIVGVLVMASENEDANKNPKSTFRRQVHDACMEKRGYRKKG